MLYTLQFTNYLFSRLLTLTGISYLRKKSARAPNTDLINEYQKINRIVIFWKVQR